ncbi:HGGxSTG domain-containing protein [Legionella pneumophila serogroup 6]|uniref:HGGxSTG domain-containing protein n=1 Tax=Legionella pneumophila TaxID=446 RepID=UPI0023B8BD08|nr:HGGxSTG domain-containing protein [Legionella pneumophila]
MYKRQRTRSDPLGGARCGAKTRRNTECRAPSVKNKKRCRMHGGAKGSGAHVGSKNALKHELHTEEIKKIKKTVRVALKEWKN